MSERAGHGQVVWRGGSPAEVGLHTSPRTQPVDQKTSNTGNFRERECDADQAGPRDASTAGVRISPKCPRTQQFSTEREPPVGLRGQPTARGEHAGEGSKQWFIQSCRRFRLASAPNRVSQLTKWSWFESRREAGPADSVPASNAQL